MESESLGKAINRERNTRRLSGLFGRQSTENAREEQALDDIAEPTFAIAEPESNANLLNEEEENTQPRTEIATRRSTRIKVRPLTCERIGTPGPKKLSANSSLKDIQQYYLDKKVKKQNTLLETIYEEPQQNEVMSSRKYKRIINFSASVAKNSAKVKKRKMKAKTVTAKARAGKKLSVKFVMDKLAELDEPHSD